MSRRSPLGSDGANRAVCGRFGCRLPCDHEEGDLFDHRTKTEADALQFHLKTGSARSDSVVIQVLPADSARGGKGVSRAVGDVIVVDSGSSRNRPSRTTLTVSAGPRHECVAETLRCAGGAAAKWLSAHGLARAAVELASLDKLGVDNAVEAFCEGLALGAFRFDRHKSSGAGAVLSGIDLLTKRMNSQLRQQLQRLTAVIDAVNLARDWGHEPPNVVNPVTLAARSSRLARACKLKCKVYDEKQLARMKAGAILAVGVASKTQPRLIVLEHPGVGRSRQSKPVVLVGKAITFDTGGYSLKDKDGIVGMKYDKCGGMAVIGAMKAVAALKIKTPVVGIIVAAENMISGSAYRPNDIVKTMSGKTVEIISTDAEGRMVLADALTYAQKHYKPRAIIDLATLTGGVVVALGGVRAGLFANHDGLAAALAAAGERVHERLWRLPLDDEYLQLIKGDDSDLKNSGGRSAHPVIGGMFLKQFVDKKIPWAHLDIAGTATTDKDLPYCPKGATGFGVRLLVDYIEHL